MRNGGGSALPEQPVEFGHAVHLVVGSQVAVLNLRIQQIVEAVVVGKRLFNGQQGQGLNGRVGAGAKNSCTGVRPAFLPPSNCSIL